MWQGTLVQYTRPGQGKLIHVLQIEEWYEQNYPSCVILGRDGITYDPEDKRTAVLSLLGEQCAHTKRYPNATSPLHEVFPLELATYVGGIVILLSASIGYAILKLYG